MHTLVANSYSCHLLFILRETVIDEFGSAHETGVTRANLCHSIFFLSLKLSMILQ